MSEQVLNQIKPFKQIPSCDPDTILSITGQEYATIQNLINVFEAPVNVIKEIFNRNLNEGNITIKYIQEDGTEIPESEAVKYLEQMKDFLKAKDEVVEDQPKPKSKAKLRKV